MNHERTVAEAHLPVCYDPSACNFRLRYVVSLVTVEIRAKGNLESVVLEQQDIVISGWASSVQGGAPVGFEIMIDGRVIAAKNVAGGLPSPDVERVWPDLTSANTCRFRIVVSVENCDNLIKSDILIHVSPVYPIGKGAPLRQVLCPSIPLPPINLARIVGDGFHEASLEFLDYFVKYGRLKSSDNVLDIGCGLGRMAYGLTGYLKSNARYEGFDIIPELVGWARQEITSRYPNFQFKQVPLFNSFYNPKGVLDPCEFSFPYENGVFDFFFLTSVFTHVSGDVLRHYVQEIARVSRNGANGVITAFVLTEESKALIKSGKSSLNLCHAHGDGMVARSDDPDYAIGFERESLESWFVRNGLKIREILPGSWCGRENYLTYQDLILVNMS